MNSFYAGALFRLFEDELRGVFAFPAFRAVPRITGMKSGCSIFGQN